MENNNNIQDENMEIVSTVDLYLANGEVKTFEIIEEVEYEGDSYVILTEYVEERVAMGPDEVLNVIVMKCYLDENEDTKLENVEDMSIADKVFEIFVQNQQVENE